MPVVSVRIAKGRPIETKRALVSAVAEAVAKALEVNAEWVTVLIEEYDRANWSTGGKLHSDKMGDGYGKAQRTE